MTVNELLQKVDSKELAEWQLYDTIDPIGAQRLDMNVAHLLCYIGHMLGVTKDASVMDMMLNFERPHFTEEQWKQRMSKYKKEPTKEELADRIKAAFGAK